MYTCSREVLRESFGSPIHLYYNRNFSNFRNFSLPPPPSGGWAFGFDLFPPSVLRYEPKPKTPATCSVLAADLPRPSADGSQRPELRPPLRSAPPPTCPVLRPTAAGGYAPLRSATTNCF